MAQTNLPGLVDSFIDSLDEVEDALDPLLSQSLQDSLGQVDGPLERARLLFWLAYTLHSCTWAFTKTSAVEPEQHGVTDELKRIQEYNRKITAAAKKGKSVEGEKDTQSGPSAQSEARRLPLDKDAASRFIKAAISNQSEKPALDSKFYAAEATVSDPLAGPGPHSRLSSLARASMPVKSDDAASTSADDEAADDLQVFAETVSSDLNRPTDQHANRPQDNASLDAETSGDSDESFSSAEKARKRKRLAEHNTPLRTVLDPLSGYDDEKAKKKKKRPKKQEEAIKSNMSNDSRETSPKPSQDKGKKRRKHKTSAGNS